MIRSLALLFFLTSCETRVWPDADTYGTRRALHRLAYVEERAQHTRQLYPLRIDFTKLFQKSLDLDEFGEPDTAYPSVTTLLAPTPRWKEHIQSLCLHRRGNYHGYRGGRFEPFRCYGPPQCDEYGCLEGDLLFQVSFRR